jgi:hypothetical protein
VWSAFGANPCGGRGQYGRDEAAREGFPQLEYGEFVAFFIATLRGCTLDAVVTHIEFEYVEEARGTR